MENSHEAAAEAPEAAYEDHHPDDDDHDDDDDGIIDMADGDDAAAAAAAADLATVYDRPIVVGYAFGPKKMSTMGVVMAEASKAKIVSSSSSSSAAAAATSQQQRRAAADDVDSVTNEEEEGEEEEAVEEAAGGEAGAPLSSSSSPDLKRGRFVFTMGSNRDDGGDDDDNLRHIVRHFRSSCSSVGTCSTTGACSTSVSTTFTNNHRSVSGGGVSISSSRQATTTATGNSNNNNNIPIRVSFVPLDLDIPLEDQHGGQMDVILHKLTEDILCLSQMDQEEAHHHHHEGAASTMTTTTATGTCAPQQLQRQQAAAVRRVQRLLDFVERRPPHEKPQHSTTTTTLVDDPRKVQVVMSRADIARTLERCLSSVRTASGLAVGAPKFRVVRDASELLSLPSHGNNKNNGLQFPWIVKPLTAAGTKASHALAVVLDASGLRQISKFPQLCQEYSNHDQVLYKVYVLGHHVSVHRRRSLPNLPRNTKSSKNYVEFDSQRPYPSLADFGYKDDDGNNQDDECGMTTVTAATVAASPDHLETDPVVTTTTAQPTTKHSHRQKKRPRTSSSTTTSAPPPRIITAAEVQPIVHALKQSFGLELFGFDIIVVSDESVGGNPKILVVDVNYFPSYKEVHNFPSLLAKYLTDRAIENRKRAIAAAPAATAVVR